MTEQYPDLLACIHAGIGAGYVPHGVNIDSWVHAFDVLAVIAESDGFGPGVFVERTCTRCCGRGYFDVWSTAGTGGLVFHEAVRRISPSDRVGVVRVTLTTLIKEFIDGAACARDDLTIIAEQLMLDGNRWGYWIAALLAPRRWGGWWTHPARKELERELVLVLEWQAATSDTAISQAYDGLTKRTGLVLLPALTSLMDELSSAVADAGLSMREASEMVERLSVGYSTPADPPRRATRVRGRPQSSGPVGAQLMRRLDRRR